MKGKIIIFTDLDGTLLDEKTYSFEPAKEALKVIEDLKIPLIIVSSKTAKEILHYRKLLNNVHPFVSENGGGIFIPKGYFKLMHPWLPASEKHGYKMISLGRPYRELISGLNKLKEMEFKIKGFSDLSVAEIQEITGLSEEEAKYCQERDFDEPLILDGSVDINSLKNAIYNIGLNYTSGKFLHLIGENNKGRAVRVIKDIYRTNKGEMTSIAIGDNFNDVTMFLNVDFPIAVKKAEGTHDEYVTKEVPNIIPSGGIGSRGFNESIIKILEELNEKA